MKRFFGRQWTNIIFLVLIVGAALTIYLLSRGGIVASSSASEPETATAQALSAETPAPGAEAPSLSSPRGVPVSVFLTHLETSELLTAEQSKKDTETWAIASKSAPAVTALMRYTVNDGCVSSLEITFDIPQAYEGKAGNEIEKYLKEHSDAQTGETPDAVRAMLGDLLPACDAQNRLSATTARYWAEQALLLEKNGADFEDTQSGCRFVAYRTSREGKDLLVCTMIFN